MQVTVFGASGKVGRLVVPLLLDQGHRVVAFVHSRELPLQHPQLTFEKGDIHEAKDVERALKGSDAVISCLGSWFTPTKDILSSAMRTIVPAMQAQDTRRIITLTGADALSPSDAPGYLQKVSHHLLKIVAPKILNDGEVHLNILHQSGLDWTCIRSPVMMRFGRSSYRLRLKWPLPVRTINRKAVVRAIVDQLDDRTYLRQAPTIYRR